MRALTLFTEDEPAENANGQNNNENCKKALSYESKRLAARAMKKTAIIKHSPVSINEATGPLHLPSGLIASQLGPGAPQLGHMTAR